MGWRERLRPASFRGVPFYVDSHEWQSGRRVAVHEFALRDDPSTEDLGRRTRVYRVPAYVIADLITGDYFDQRDALAAACDQSSQVGTLVHPWLGTLRVRCQTVSLRESADEGGLARFDLGFVTAGLPPSPTVTQDTAASLLGGAASLIGVIAADAAFVAQVVAHPGILLGFAQGMLGNLVGSLGGIDPAALAASAMQVARIVGSVASIADSVTSVLTGVTGDPVAVAVTDLFTALGAGVLAETPAVRVDDPVAGVPGTVAIMGSDPSGGVAALASWGAGLAVPSGPQTALQAQFQGALIDLVRGAAVLAVTQIYAGTAWISANAANAARVQLQGLLNARVAASAVSGDDALYQAWMGISGLALADLTQRAQALPVIATYAAGRVLPAPKLAQMLYRDGSQAQALAALNSAIHPAFLPASGVYLQATP